MAPSLAGAFAKIDQALLHIHALNAEILGFRSLYTYELVPDRDEEKREDLVRLRATAEPQRFWPVQIGEIIHDLRSALDHLVWQLVNLEQGEPDRSFKLPPWRRALQFPVYKVEPNGGFDAATAKMLRHVAGKDRSAIRDMQPYIRSKEDPTADLLWRLADLSNTDKHRTLHLTAPFLECFQDTPCITFETTDGTVASLWTASSGPIADNEILARFQIHANAPNPKVEIKPNFMLDIGLDEPSPLAGWPMPIAMALVTIRGAVEAILCGFQHRFPADEPRQPQAVLLDARVGPVQLE